MSKFDWYPGDDQLTHFKRYEDKPPQPTKLRGDLKPGQVLILLTGRFRGKRVIFLNQLDDGNLLVTGPFKLNGVPLRRVAQCYTLKTSTVVDINGSDAKSIKDYFFDREDDEPTSKEQKFFTAGEYKSKPASDERKKAQKKIDEPILAGLKKNVVLKKYLKTRFTLTAGQRAHALKF